MLPFLFDQPSLPLTVSIVGHWRAVNMTSEAVDKFIEKQRERKMSDASIHAQTCYLGIALKRGKLPIVSKFRRLKVNNARQGFFERGDFEAVVANLPVYLQDVARFGFVTGWRKREILTLKWSDVDHAGRIIRLRAEQSKTGKGRVLTLDGEVAEIIERRKRERRLCPTVFHHGGKPIKDFWRAWRSACKKAGVTGRIFHDLRRTFVRNAVRAGAPERVVMEISGHRSRSVFDRYNIVSEDDLRTAMRKTSEYVSTQPEHSNVRALTPKRGAAQ